MTELSGVFACLFLLPGRGYREPLQSTPMGQLPPLNGQLIQQTLLYPPPQE